jgi:dienelactone hydrolase
MPTTASPLPWDDSTSLHFLFIFKFFFLGSCHVMGRAVSLGDKYRTNVEKDQLVPFLESMGCSKFAMIGFCYGSWVVFKACSCSSSELSKRITCGLHFHPAVAPIEKDIFGRNVLDLCKACTQPQLVHVTRQEPKSWQPGGAAHQVLQHNPNVMSNLSFTLAPSTVAHGFMTRSDINDMKSAKAVEAGVEMACNFLKLHNQ